MNCYGILKKAAYTGIAVTAACAALLLPNLTNTSSYSDFEKALEEKGVHVGYTDRKYGVVGIVLDWPSAEDVKKKTTTFNPNSRNLQAQRKNVEEKIRELAPIYGFGVKGVTDVRFGTGGVAIVYAVLDNN